jgi:hypothetical protein
MPLLSLAAFGGDRAGAQSALPEGFSVGGHDASCVLSSTFVSQDLFRGTFLGGASIEPCLDLSNGAYDLGVWSNSTVRNRVEGPSSTEVEIYGSYTEEVVRDRVSVAPGFTLYAPPWGPGFDGKYRASIEPSLALNYSAGGAQFSPKAYYDLVLKALTLEIDAGYTVPLRSAHTELDFTATLGASSGLGAVVQLLAPWSFDAVLCREGRHAAGLCYTGSTHENTVSLGAGRASDRTESGRGLFTLSYAIRL